MHGHSDIWFRIRAVCFSRVDRAVEMPPTSPDCVSSALCARIGFNRRGFNGALGGLAAITNAAPKASVKPHEAPYYGPMYSVTVCRIMGYLYKQHGATPHHSRGFALPSAPLTPVLPVLRCPHLASHKISGDTPVALVVTRFSAIAFLSIGPA